MKNLSFLLVVLLCIGSFLQAQVPPQAFNYSAVARNASGQPIASATIGIQTSILKGTTTGPVQYSENHVVNTDAFGLFNLVIGAGAIQSGSMNSIIWSNDNYYLKVGMDATGGTNFLTMGTTQLLSVPYAMHAGTADSVTNLDISSLNQNFSVSYYGDTLYISNGNWVIIPGISLANDTTILGLWSVSDNCSQSGTASYMVIIQHTVNLNEYLIINFWGAFSNPVIATVSGNTINIARQEPDGDNFFVVGTGTINASQNQITINYTVSDETNPQNISSYICSSTWIEN